MPLQIQSNMALKPLGNVLLGIKNPGPEIPIHPC